MNRLSEAWSACIAWLSCWIAQAKAVREAERKVREIRRQLKAADHSRQRLASRVSSMRNEVDELRQDLRDAKHEQARLENELELSQHSLEYQIQWQEKAMERMRMEAAIYIRRRIEAVSGDAPTLLDDLGD